jgi:hypothetical protein
MMKKTNKAKTKNPHQQESAAQTLGRARPEIAKALAQRWAPGAAQPATATQFRAELKAHQVERLLAQVDSQAEELVDAIMGRGAASAAGATEKGPRAHGVSKLGFDVHLDRYVVVRQVDGGAPQPAQRFSPAQFLEWTKKQTELKGVSHRLRLQLSDGYVAMSAHPAVQRGVCALGSPKLHVCGDPFDRQGGLASQTCSDDKLARLVFRARRQITLAPLQSTHFFFQAIRMHLPAGFLACFSQGLDPALSSGTGGPPRREICPPADHLDPSRLSRHSFNGGG